MLFEVGYNGPFYLCHNPLYQTVISPHVIMLMFVTVGGCPLSIMTLWLSVEVLDSKILDQWPPDRKGQLLFRVLGHERGLTGVQVIDCGRRKYRGTVSILDSLLLSAHSYFLKQFTSFCSPFCTRFFRHWPVRILSMLFGGKNTEKVPPSLLKRKINKFYQKGN